jgi:hypothetical protein
MLFTAVSNISGCLGHVTAHDWSTVWQVNNTEHDVVVTDLLICIPQVSLSIPGDFMV